MKSVKTAIALIALGHTLHAENLSEVTWPKTFETSAYEIALYQPQVQEWTEFKHCDVSLAIGIKAKGTGQQTFGAMAIEAPTVTDFEERVVHFGDRKVTSIRFPEARDEVEAATLERALRSILTPSKPLQISLDDMLANVDRTQIQNREVKANLAPPPIHFASQPTILVMFLGDPKFEAIKEIPGMLSAVNTNWDLFLDTKTTTYYLLTGDFWLSTRDLEKGPWSPVKLVPDALYKLPADDNWAGVRAKLTAPTARAGDVPAIIIAKQPSELILTDGEPELAPISGTSILTIANTESDVFLHGPSQHYYFLAAGRWFKATKLEGPWTAATVDLPSDFADIPEDHEKAHVLSSVPGTAAADEAVILASIPQTATVNRNEIKFAVKYEGEPEFVAIPGAAVKYAANTNSDVFLVDGKYYACHEGVWFEAPAATGPWIVCDKVPDAIYAIPAESPKHNVTYVHVYESTPATVQVGYTSGYNGAVIANGLVMFGLGYWLGHDHDHHHHYWYRYPPHAHYYGYGCGAYYNPYYGTYRRAGHVYYGPYGGAGGQAIYNPWTGGYARGGYRYGPNGSAFAREAYNPWTNTYAARAGASTPYGSWGRSVVVRDDEWMRTGHATNWRGTVAGGQTSKGGAALKIDRRFGPDAGAIKTRNDDVYVGRDGNIYKRDSNGDWSKRDNGGWANTKVSREAPRNWSEKTSRPAIQKPTPGTTRPGTPNITRPTMPKITPSPSRAEVEKRRQQIAQRPTIQPTRTPQRSTYTPPTRQSTPRQLDWDSRSRDRSSFQRTTPTRSRSSTSRSSSRMPSRSTGRSRSGGLRGR